MEAGLLKSDFKGNVISKGVFVPFSRNFVYFIWASEFRIDIAVLFKPTYSLIWPSQKVSQALL